WERMGHKTFLARNPWPSYDPELAKEEKITIVVQVNGKLRDRFETERDSEEGQLKEAALGLDRIKKIIGDQKVKRVIYIKNKLINIVL
ncbi:MAG: leucine--tRNA ligase, partial [Candidatus Aminicenantes bacterium]|nr:leucine--tRNA ligase [Candidatus Aminicenantes bacterium]